MREITSERMRKKRNTKESYLMVCNIAPCGSPRNINELIVVIVWILCAKRDNRTAFYANVLVLVAAVVVGHNACACAILSVFIAPTIGGNLFEPHSIIILLCNH